MVRPSGVSAPAHRNPIILDRMIYLVYDGQELIAETDSLEFLKVVVKEHPECAVKELTSGKLYKPRLVRKAS
jgi:hypothetical protein